MSLLGYEHGGFTCSCFTRTAANCNFSSTAVEDVTTPLRTDTTDVLQSAYAPRVCHPVGHCSHLTTAEHTSAADPSYASCLQLHDTGTLFPSHVVVVISADLDTPHGAACPRICSGLAGYTA